MELVCEIDVSSSDMCLQVTWMRTAVALVVWNLCKNSVLPKVRCSTALSGPFRSGGLPAGGSGSTASLGMRFRTGSNLAALVFSRSCRQLDSFASTTGGGSGFSTSPPPATARTPEDDPRGSWLRGRLHSTEGKTKEPLPVYLSR